MFISHITAQKNKIEEKKSLSISGYSKHSQLKKFVKDLTKGRKLKEGETNEVGSNVEYLDLIEKNKQTNNSAALYQFSIAKEHIGVVTESIRTGLGFMEPIYSIDFEIMTSTEDMVSDNVKYFLVPNKEASRALHNELKEVFNLVDFEETWSVFTEKFEANAANRAEEFLTKYFKFIILK